MPLAGRTTASTRTPRCSSASPMFSVVRERPCREGYVGRTTESVGTLLVSKRSDAMSEQAAVLNHTGLCVSDAERSVRFYTEVFGFRYWRDFEPPDELAAPLLGLQPPLDHYNVYLRLGGFVLELLVFRGTPPHPPATRRVMNELGLTHLS